MAVSVAAVMRHVRNFFERGWLDGAVRISGGVLSVPVNSPYIAISGSAYNDGVYRMISDTAAERPFRDETFDGRIWLLHPPDDFLSLCEDASRYDDHNPVGALKSETFGDYSYTRASAFVTGGMNTWETAFAARLRPYVRMFTEVDA